MNILLLGYTGSGREEVAKSISYRYGMRLLNKNNLTSAYKEIFYGNPSSDIEVQKGKNILLTISEVYRGDHLLLDGLPETIKEASLLNRVLKSFDRKIDYVFFFLSKLEETVSYLVNGNPDEREIIRNKLLEEKKKILDVGKFFLKYAFESYLLKRNRDHLSGLEGKVLDVLEHREFPIEHSQLPS